MWEIEQHPQIGDLESARDLGLPVEVTYQCDVSVVDTGVLYHWFLKDLGRLFGSCFDVGNRLFGCLLLLSLVQYLCGLLFFNYFGLWLVRLNLKWSLLERRLFVCKLLLFVSLLDFFRNYLYFFMFLFLRILWLFRLNRQVKLCRGLLIQGLLILFILFNLLHLFFYDNLLLNLRFLQLLMLWLYDQFVLDLLVLGMLCILILFNLLLFLFLFLLLLPNFLLCVHLFLLLLQLFLVIHYIITKTPDILYFNTHMLRWTKHTANLFTRLTISSKFNCISSKTINKPIPRGKLMIIPTPIGNLGDLSPNIIKALYSADLIGCEDRRIAGQLYHLIRSRKIVSQMQQRFGTLGLTNLVEVEQETILKQQQNHKFYEYASMTDKKRRKFLRRMPQAQQTAFRIQFLKYRAKKVLNKNNQWIYPSQPDRFDQLYGIDLSDMKYIQQQIMNCRKRKGRGVLIPLNTYNQTRMFDMVRGLLESRVVAVVSDAGMPCISDPGWKLVDKIRNTMPGVAIEVVGGPSSVSILALQASICAKGKSLSGRFEGFSSLSTGNFDQKNRQMQKTKMKQFSIHFINANKLKGRLLELQKVFGTNQKIILNNQLTKKYERRFEGTVVELLNKIDDPEFKPVGQISYLLYPQREEVQEQQEELIEETGVISVGDELNLTQKLNISVPTFVELLQKHQPSLRPRQRVQLLCDIFSIKPGQARQFVYQKYAKQD